MSWTRRLLQEESGQDIVEYALLASFLSLIAILTIRNFGPVLGPVWESIRHAFISPGQNNPHGGGRPGIF